MGLTDLLEGLPELYHPIVTAVWRHREGVRDVVELNDAADALFRHAVDLMELREYIDQVPDHPNHWRLISAAWATVYWEDRTKMRGSFWRNFHAGSLPSAASALVLLSCETDDERRDR
ncbi:hypothetical protein QLT00_gp06 [Gordonia phage Commandaria]|uniref:Uncharacterized protein n=1 Tax=Gordonia phage Commandaria TaxID=3038364 RepID=A0AAF0GI00_9CAUD|nr:hypothetical protein QLT00_gp06 [Gordonia phage Commandaria]WGH20789.1 hypothetical protein [Gordonia phage Commandaria]